jgi:hypothetical protein
MKQKDGLNPGKVILTIRLEMSEFVDKFAC